MTQRCVGCVQQSRLHRRTPGRCRQRVHGWNPRTRGHGTQPVGPGASVCGVRRRRPLSRERNAGPTDFSRHTLWAIRPVADTPHSIATETICSDTPLPSRWAVVWRPVSPWATAQPLISGRAHVLRAHRATLLDDLGLPGTQDFFCSTFGSRGRPSTLSPTMLRWISAVPPQIVSEREKKNADIIWLMG